LRIPNLVAVGLVVALTLSGCKMVRSGFATEAGTAGDELTAAAVTLRYVHEGRITKPYARSAFDNYREVLLNFEPKLRHAKGAPSGAEVNRLVAVYRAAVPVLKAPCLDDGCGWQGQAATLEAAAATLSKASGG
jgi:hypothetical protein